MYTTAWIELTFLALLDRTLAGLLTVPVALANHLSQLLRRKVQHPRRAGKYGRACRSLRNAILAERTKCLKLNSAPRQGQTGFRK